MKRVAATLSSMQAFFEFLVLVGGRSLMSK
jgi:hypothetical protein